MLIYPNWVFFSPRIVLCKMFSRRGNRAWWTQISKIQNPKLDLIENALIFQNVEIKKKKRSFWNCVCFTHLYLLLFFTARFQKLRRSFSLLRRLLIGSFRRRWEVFKILLITKQEKSWREWLLSPLTWQGNALPCSKYWISHMPWVTAAQGCVVLFVHRGPV